MKISLSFSISLLLVMFITSANAHCYSRWYYPRPQNCNHIMLEDRSHVWYVEITKLPPSWADERETGIEKLKEQMK